MLHGELSMLAQEATMRQTVGSERSSTRRFCIALGPLLTGIAAACAVNPVSQQSEQAVSYTFQIVDIAAPPIGGTMCATDP